MTASEYVEKTGCKITTEACRVRLDAAGTGWGPGAVHYRFILRNGRKSYSGYYSMGSALTGEPKPADILCSLVMDAESAREPFEDFCGNFGYDADSRKAFAIYKACERTAQALVRLFGEIPEITEG